MFYFTISSRKNLTGLRKEKRYKKQKHEHTPQLPLCHNFYYINITTIIILVLKGAFSTSVNLCCTVSWPPLYILLISSVLCVYNKIFLLLKDIKRSVVDFICCILISMSGNWMVCALLYFVTEFNCLLYLYR